MTNPICDLFFMSAIRFLLVLKILSSDASLQPLVNVGLSGIEHGYFADERHGFRDLVVLGVRRQDVHETSGVLLFVQAVKLLGEVALIVRTAGARGPRAVLSRR